MGDLWLSFVRLCDCAIGQSHWRIGCFLDRTAIGAIVASMAGEESQLLGLRAKDLCAIVGLLLAMLE